ncbi:DUF1097 domain-containing protein [Candidatus Colwellia aromaticivorans]|uniref:DUF1097 domain-containing protein n=1 Tax=Candidatus Colwellia aromaticivorans TaxID=2267621 RepID=UPI000DF36D0B|nr:DUF1097 domain-containing protein [Candidatus Colwellia aromaticivorans]
MKEITATSLSIGLVGAIATRLAFGLLSGYILIWAVFIAWAGFAALGGDNQALKSTIICGVFGVVIGWIAAFMVLSIPLADTLGMPLWSAVVVGITAFTVVFASNFPILGAVPASVLSYAATFAYLLQTSERMTLITLTSINFENPILLISLSVIFGGIFGKVSVIGATYMTKEA